MSWATQYIEQLKKGETIQFRPKGNSMIPKIKSGQLCTVKPVKAEDLKADDIVLCVVRGRQFLHIVHAIKGKEDKRRYEIGNNKGFINGWVGGGAIYGKLIKVGN